MKNKIESQLLVLSLVFFVYQTAKFDPQGSEWKAGREEEQQKSQFLKTRPDIAIPTKPLPELPTSSQATPKTPETKPGEAKSQLPKKEQLPKSPEAAPETQKKPGFSFTSFKKFFSFGSNDETKKSKVPTTEQPKFPVKTTEPFKLKPAETKVAEVPEAVKAVKDDVAKIPQNSIDKFRNLGGSLSPKDLSPKEKKALIEVGDKVSAMSKAELDSLSPEEKLQVHMILQARTVQFQMGENLAAKIDEEKKGLRGVIQAAQKRGASVEALQKQLEQKDADLKALDEMYGFKFPQTENMKSHDKTAQKNALEEFKKSLNEASRGLGTEFDLRANIVKSQAAEIAKLAEQKTKLTPQQAQLRDSYCRNIVAIHDLAEKAKGDANNAERLKNAMDYTQKKINVLENELISPKDRAREDVEKDLAIARTRFDDINKGLQDIEEGKKQIPQAEEIMVGSKQIFKQIAPSFIRDQKTKAKKLAQDISKKKSTLEMADKNQAITLKSLQYQYNVNQPKLGELGGEIDQLKQKIDQGESSTVEKEGTTVIEYRQLSENEKAYAQKLINEKQKTHKEIQEITKQLQAKITSLSEKQTSQSAEIKTLEREYETIRKGIASMQEMLK